MDNADDVAAMEYDPTDIARSLEYIEAASSELVLRISWAETGPEFKRWSGGSCPLSK